MANHYPKFFDFFKNYQNNYVLIGGQAASILLEAAGQITRATVDFDIIVIFEKADQDFLNHLKVFLREYHYLLDGRKSEERKYYYRFRTVKNSEVPEVIELFSRVSANIILEDPNTIEIPLPDEDDSLSAISLDDGYYGILKNGIEISQYVDGPVLKPAYLILFKAKAQLDIVKRQEEGERVNHRDKMKHKKDILNLLNILTDDDTIPADSVSEQVKRDLADYIDWLENQPDLGHEIIQRKLERFRGNPNKAKEKVITALRQLIV
ncbi:hypothetical protein [Oenococcus sp.]|uniref:hypothetical protein n=1 Tax=Oenococcus sp. TaxID=1979414 RepID=UPI0039EC8148